MRLQRKGSQNPAHKEGGAGEGDELLEPRPDLGDLRHAAREPEAVGPGGLHEVLLMEGLVGARVAVGVEEILPLPHQPVARLFRRSSRSYVNLRWGRRHTARFVRVTA